MTTSKHPLAELADLAGKTLLLVDDNMVVRIATSAVAARIGLIPTAAPGGEAALAALRQSAFDAVLMDLAMPGLDGLQATRAIRSSGEPWLAVPVIGMSATVDAEETRRCIEAGMILLLAKPITAVALADAIAAALTASPRAGQSD